MLDHHKYHMNIVSAVLGRYHFGFIVHRYMHIVVDHV